MNTSRVMLFCPDAEISRMLVDTQPPTFDVTCVDNGVDFRKMVPSLDGALIYITDGLAPMALRDVAEMTQRFPLKTMVMAARRGIRLTVPYTHVEVTPPLNGHTGRHVWDEYYYAWVRTRLTMLAHGLRQAGMSATITGPLTCALLSRTPIVSVDALVNRTGVNRKTLWRHWDTEAHPRWNVRLLDVLDWITLVHVTARKRPERSYASLADWLGLNLRTLGRQAKRLTGHTLSELTTLDKEDVFRAFSTQFAQLFIHS